MVRYEAWHGPRRTRGGVDLSPVSVILLFCSVVHVWTVFHRCTKISRSRARDQYRSRICPLRNHFALWTQHYHRLHSYPYVDNFQINAINTQINRILVGHLYWNCSVVDRSYNSWLSLYVLCKKKPK